VRTDRRRGQAFDKLSTLTDMIVVRFARRRRLRHRRLVDDVLRATLSRWWLSFDRQQSVLSCRRQSTVSFVFGRRRPAHQNLIGSPGVAGVFAVLRFFRKSLRRLTSRLVTRPVLSHPPPAALVCSVPATATG